MTSERETWQTELNLRQRTGPDDERTRDVTNRAEPQTTHWAWWRANERRDKQSWTSDNALSLMTSEQGTWQTELNLRQRTGPDDERTRDVTNRAEPQTTHWAWWWANEGRDKQSWTSDNALGLMTSERETWQTELNLRQRTEPDDERTRDVTNRAEPQTTHWAWWRANERRDKQSWTSDKPLSLMTSERETWQTELNLRQTTGPDDERTRDVTNRAEPQTTHWAWWRANERRDKQSWTSDNALGLMTSERETWQTELNLRQRTGPDDERTRDVTNRAEPQTTHWAWWRANERRDKQSWTSDNALSLMTSERETWQTELNLRQRTGPDDERTRDVTNRSEPQTTHWVWWCANKRRDKQSWTSDNTLGLMPDRTRKRSKAIRKKIPGYVQLNSCGARLWLTNTIPSAFSAQSV